MMPQDANENSHRANRGDDGHRKPHRSREDEDTECNRRVRQPQVKASATQVTAVSSSKKPVRKEQTWQCSERFAPRAIDDVLIGHPPSRERHVCMTLINVHAAKITP